MPPSAGTSLKPVKRMPAPKTLPKIGASDFTRDLDLSQEELLALLDLTQQLKSQPTRFAKALAGRYISMLFEKPSLRTRLTFELAIEATGRRCGSDRRAHRRPRAAEGRRAQPGPLDQRHRRAHLLAEDHRRAGALVERAGDQRAQRPLPSLPGAGRCLHAAGKVRRSARPEARLRRRRQQRRAFADARVAAARHELRASPRPPATSRTPTS